MNATGKQFENLIRIITKLRQPDGCPWDRRQTPQSLKTYIIEEAYELLEAVDKDDGQLVMEELGDLLFQIILVTSMYAEKGTFSHTDVIETIAAKMIRRHPHVFGDSKAKSEEELRRQWHAIKKTENKENGQPHKNILDSIPKNLPALRRAHRITERVERSGFEWPDREMLMNTLETQAGNLKDAFAAGDHEKITGHLGHLLFLISNLSRMYKVNSEEALQKFTDSFAAGFKSLEETLAAEGKTFDDLGTEEKSKYWRQMRDDCL